MTVTRRSLLFGASSMSVLALRSAQQAAPSHPTVYITPRDIERAKENIAHFDWARATLQSILRDADPWLLKEDAWFRATVPPSGAVFAYGFSGCPVCGGSLGPWWGSANTSFDNPGHVTCMKGHVLPDQAHPDSGTGYVGPDGHIYYFAGVYNAWVVERLTDALGSLSDAYTLTSDERYAGKACVLFDSLAASYPGCDKGSWDYPSNPNRGRFNRNWYQVSRVLIHYVDNYDQLYNSRHLDAPSLKPGLTRRQNIEENLLKNGAEFCYELSKEGGLQNGEADYERGVLAAGVCLNHSEYIRWAVDGPYGIRTLLANNVDRDGAYFEASTMYADHTRDLYFTFAEPLFNYRGSAYPAPVDLYRDPKLRAFFLLHNLSQNCAGHTPTYGDSAPDLKRIAAPAHPFDASDDTFLRRLYARSTDAAGQRDLAGALRWLERGNPALSPDPDSLAGHFDARRWALFHWNGVPPGPAVLPPGLVRRLTRSDFLGQKGIGVLRAGKGPEAQAALLRFGPSLVHGQADDLNLDYFAKGYELTYYLGYQLDSSHTYRGWSSQTASHNLVVVNETSQMQDGGTGGSLHLFADLPALQLIEASSEASYAAQGVTLYRRTVALVGENPRYLVDLFRVNGGTRHDWMFHSQGPGAEFGGLELGAVEPGSLAGPDISWGDKQMNDGDLEGHANQRSWTPLPPNGYGFLIQPQRARANGQWHADWKIDDTAHVRVTVPATPELEVLTAVAPGIHPGVPHARYVVARRRGDKLASQFAAAIEPYSQRSSIQSIERLPLAGTGAEVAPVALKIVLRDGLTDYVFSSGDAARHAAAGIVFAGKFAQLRLQGEQLQSLSLVAATEFSGFGWTVRPAAGWTGVAAGVDPDRNIVATDAALPLDGSLDGQVITFANPGYSRTTAYRIQKVQSAGGKRLVHLHATVVLGKGLVESVRDEHTFLCPIPHEYARPHRRNGDTTFFQGKRIRSQSGATTRIHRLGYGQPMTLNVENARGFKPGETFYYDDVQAGDNFFIASLVSITAASGSWRLGGNVKAMVTAPAGAGLQNRK